MPNKLKIKHFVRKITNKLKSTNKVNSLLILFIIILFVVTCPKSFAQDFQYKGIYTAEQVFTTFCDSCYLELPAEYLQTNLVLSVNTDNVRTFERALISASKGNGWTLTKSGTRWRAEPVQNDGNLVYISCMTNEPVNVPKYLYHWAIKSDSIKCYMRNLEQVKQDSLYKLEQIKQDSLYKINDSLSKISLPYTEYELRYYSFTKNFADKLGVEWSEVLAVGDLPKHFELLDNWSFFATATNDTAYTRRQLNVSLDSSVTLDWGTEEQTLVNSLVSDGGVVSNNYEWRKYGLIVTITATGEKTRLQYIFRDKENGVSLLQGSAVARAGDTIRVTGQYIATREVQRGIPLLSSIPFVGILFETKQNLSDLKNFELYLIPNKKGRFEHEKEN